MLPLGTPLLTPIALSLGRCWPIAIVPPPLPLVPGLVRALPEFCIACPDILGLIYSFLKDKEIILGW